MSPPRTTQDFCVRRDDLHQVSWTPARDNPERALAAGEVLLRVDRFGFSANNITYALLGELAQYWKFFPAPEGFGRVPVWGYADVVASSVPELPEGSACTATCRSRRTCSYARIRSTPPRVVMPANIGAPCPEPINSIFARAAVIRMKTSAGVAAVVRHGLPDRRLAVGQRVVRRKAHRVGERVEQDGGGDRVLAGATRSARLRDRGVDVTRPSNVL